jgi:hypothetical protein
MNSIPKLVQQLKPNLNKVKTLKLTFNVNFKTKSMCMAFSRMGTCEKDEWHDLQRIRKKHDLKNFEHIIPTLSYQRE